MNIGTYTTALLRSNAVTEVFHRQVPSQKDVMLNKMEIIILVITSIPQLPSSTPRLQTLVPQTLASLILKTSFFFFNSSSIVRIINNCNFHSHLSSSFLVISL